MNTVKRIWSNRSIAKSLSMGFIVIGIALVCWSVIQIQAQTVTGSDNLPSNMTWAIKNSIGHQVVHYVEYPSVGDKIGTLSIPSLNQSWPIIEGTGDEELKNGVGHFSQSVLPGTNDNCVLSGHRDTIFSEIGKLKIKQKMIVQTPAGTFTYEISRIRIVDKDDKTVIVPTDHAVLTVTTCYPFHYIGSAPKRYILSADLVRNE